MALLECKNISVTYDKSPVITDVNFSVEQGDYLCIVGENGSGKSTLIKTILGIVNKSSGEILFADDFSKHEIGYLPQTSSIRSDFPASVWEVVLSGCLNNTGKKPFYSSKEKDLAERNMALLGITELKKECYNTLSGGQRQKVLLARALCASSRLLILDEPTTGLDPIATPEFYKTVKRLNKEQNITVIAVTHDINTALCDSNKILHLSHKGHFFGDTSDYIKNTTYFSFTHGDLT